MYLISQMWWYLLLSFLLGALIGYLLWRACNRPLLESRFERARKDLTSRIGLLERERAQAAAPSGDAEIANLKAEAADASKKAATALRTALENEKSEAAAKHAAELKKARGGATVSLAASHAAEVKKLQDTAKSHETRVLALSEENARRQSR